MMMATIGVAWACGMVLAYCLMAINPRNDD